MKYFTLENSDAKFYHKVTKEDASPLEKMLLEKIPNEIGLSIQDKKGRRSYGAMTQNELQKYYTQNLHLYEICRNDRRFYFDIEFTTENDHTEQFNSILTWIKNFVGTFTKVYECYTTDGHGNGEAGHFIGIQKYSYHIILHTEHYLCGMASIKSFKSYLHNAMVKSDNVYLRDGLITDGWAIDLNIYSKNQSFKLPFQSKSGSTRFHKPREDGTLNDYLVSPLIMNCLPLEIKHPDVVYKKVIDENTRKVVLKTDKINATEEKIVYELADSFTGQDTIEWDGNDDLYTIVNLIPNNDKVTYQLYRDVMFGIRRASSDCIRNKNDDGLQLFLSWAKKYSRYNEQESTTAFYNANPHKGYGYSTLLTIASYCCPALREKKSYIERLQMKRTPDIIVNTNRFNINDYKQHNVIAVNSPMGTGKTYGFRNIPKKASCIFLSSRQAYANSQSTDFKDFGFANYLDEEFTGYESRAFISLESIHHLKRTQYDYLVIDESETIFNIISSDTLIKNQFKNSIEDFSNLIKTCKNVIVMDAFLTERSLVPVETIRNQQCFYIKNTHPAPERTASFVENKKLVENIIENLKANKRCVFVTGSRTFGDWAVEHIKRDCPDKKVLYYNCYNRLPLTTNVNEEWSKIDLLIYTPSITCGISYTDPNHFDNLFIYAVNMNSAHFRDIIQASRRCRHIKNKHISICLNTKFKVSETQYPCHPDIINSHKKENFNILRDNVASDITNLTEYNTWVDYVDTFNIMERNIHCVYLKEVCLYYFGLENILILIDESITDFQLDHNLKEDTEVKASDIRLLTSLEYNNLTYKMKREKLQADELNEYKYYVFQNWLKEEHRQADTVDTLYDMWGNTLELQNIKTLKKIQTSYTDRIVPKGAFAEHTNKNVIPLLNLYNSLHNIDGMGPEAIDCEKKYRREDFASLPYKNMTASQIHKMCDKQVFKMKKDIGSDGKVSKFDDKKTITVLRALLDKIGYEISSTTKKISKKRVYEYKIQPIEGRTDILPMLYDGMREITEKIDTIELVEKVTYAECIEKSFIQTPTGPTALDNWIRNRTPKIPKQVPHSWKVPTQLTITLSNGVVIPVMKRQRVMCC